ncbi:hypothetical protein FXR79_03050 [Campylobacter coli]|uniref:hypothetical protein n=2 Tax=Campylobacter coli TaxID=195 RepID=UPI001D0DE34A|nr:hypothetical protein [Campylobacter coli]MCC2553098.1 hypothetical protein [Campylobacter coli]
MSIKKFIDNLKNWKSSLKIKQYDFHNYSCEISELFYYIKYQERLDSSFLEKWKKIFQLDFFELYHPIFNNIKTRAILNFEISEIGVYGNYVLMVDLENKHPWLFCQFHHTAEMFITQEGIFYSPLAFDWSKWYMREYLSSSLDKMLKTIDIEELKFKNIPCAILLNNPRPWHYFRDNLSWLYFFELQNKFFKGPSYFIPKHMEIQEIRSNNDYVFVYPSVFYHYQSDFLNDIVRNMYQNVYSESTLEVKQDQGQYDLKIWLGLPGERRAWLQQIDGVENIIKELFQYFSNIKLYFDGMTAFENENMDFKDNNNLFLQIKHRIEKINSKEKRCQIRNMIGLDYRNKIKYCSKVDFSISDACTTSLTPLHFCNKPFVGFYGNISFVDLEILRKYYPKIKLVSDKYKKILNHKPGSGPWAADFHIPFQHIYNLVADVIEEIKGIKMHRLEVPSVDLVATSYELEQKYNIKFPIEYVGIYNEYKNILSDKADWLFNEIQKLQSLQNDINKKNENFSNMIKERELEYFKILEEKYKLQIADLCTNNKIANQQNQDLLKKINENACFIYIEEHESAKLRVREHLAYKLGQAMIVNSKTLLGYIKMPFVLSYIKDKHKQEQKIYQENIKKDPSLKLPPLESYPDYKEALKEKECLTYKLGESLIKANKTWYKGGYIKLWFEIRRIKLEFKNKKEKK